MRLGVEASDLDLLQRLYGPRVAAKLFGLGVRIEPAREAVIQSGEARGDISEVVAAFDRHLRRLYRYEFELANERIEPLLESLARLQSEVSQ